MLDLNHHSGDKMHFESCLNVAGDIKSPAYFKYSSKVSKSFEAEGILWRNYTAESWKGIMMSKTNRFEIIEKSGGGLSGALCKVIIDKTTGVNYLYVENGYSGGLTVLVDENGKPIVTRMIEELPFY